MKVFSFSTLSFLGIPFRYNQKQLYIFLLLVGGARRFYISYNRKETSLKIFTNIVIITHRDDYVFLKSWQRTFYATNI